jgi:hypothetical protein
LDFCAVGAALLFAIGAGALTAASCTAAQVGLANDAVSAVEAVCHVYRELAPLVPVVEGKRAPSVQKYAEKCGAVENAAGAIAPLFASDAGGGADARE